MLSEACLVNLVLDGVVQYSTESTEAGELVLKAKWVSTRIVASGKTGTGHATRRGSVSKEKSLESGFTGPWTIEYYGPDGHLAVTPFLLDIEKTGDIYRAKWADPDGRPLLEGFGFEDHGKLYMHYGDRMA